MAVHTFRGFFGRTEIFTFANSFYREAITLFFIQRTRYYQQQSSHKMMFYKGINTFKRK